MFLDETTFDNTASRSRPRLHLRWTGNGSGFVYCYIRKNACTAFKQFLRDHAVAEGGPIKATAYRTITRSYRLRLPAWRAGRRPRVFVYRDPFERIAALFLNKFVQQNGHEDLLRRVGYRTGCDPAEMSFEDFVHDYIGDRTEELDPHLWTQRSHLAPMVYTHALSLPMVGSGMASILGEELAARHFAKPVNTTSHAARGCDMPGAAKRPAAELRRHYQADGTLPAARALLASGGS